jgi:hypothetical protein
VSRPPNEGTTGEEGFAQGKADAVLVFSTDLFNDKNVRGLIDDWIVINLVDEFLQSKKLSHEIEDLEHN